ncbi:MAG: hypothetical protein IJI41_12995 [Anaerolineaceae bacterium]|nr:hypothetical protein [Anaerolineaceae bacterium]
MIVSDQYECSNQVNSTIVTTTLEMLIAELKSLYISLFFQSLQIAAKLLTNTSKEGGKKTLKEKTPKRLKISRENSFAF